LLGIEFAVMVEGSFGNNHGEISVVPSQITTVELFVQRGLSDRSVMEEVRAKPLGRHTFEIAQSPGLVLGLAAGDVIELDSRDQSRFRVVKRGGNICVQIFCPAVSDKIEQRFAAAMARVAGWLDGRSSKQLVFTVPATGDFRALETILNSLIAGNPGCEWYYGNVYDPRDGTTPLNWWQQS
jgi:Domain of unknown function (DUF4265)